ncbi:hypothetical protein CWC28_21630, partial [Pseudoalteromonas sp. S4492]|uniref:hypothetical protein n=1 Tax=Pseudoalteromonas sp. S4492 TaxID=579560 RepID=UPI00110BC177
MSATEQAIVATTLSDAYLILARLTDTQLSPETAQNLLLNGLDIRQLKDECEHNQQTYQRQLSRL